MYSNIGVGYNNESNDLPPKESAKAKDLEAKAMDEFNKAIPALEKAHELDKTDKSVSKILLQLYVKTGQNDKYSKLKDEIANQKKETKPQ